MQRPGSRRRRAAWPGAIRSPIAAGLTNQNFRVEVDGRPFFVRLPGASTDLLAVDRANELHNTRAAAEAGVGPRLVAHDPASGAFALEWIDGRTMSNAAFAEPGTPARIAEALRRLHAGPRFRDDFDMFRLSEYYLRVVDERGARGSRTATASTWPRSRGSRRRSPCTRCRPSRATTTCSPRTTSTTARACGSSTTSTAATTTRRSSSATRPRSSASTTARQEELCAAYFGPERFAREGPALLARMRLQMIMSDVGWTLWAAIQAAISTIDYDFWGWAEERWGRASAAIDGRDFDDLLAQAIGN